MPFMNEAVLSIIQLRQSLSQYLEVHIAAYCQNNEAVKYLAFKCLSKLSQNV